jgi:hypothetical protein
MFFKRRREQKKKEMLEMVKSILPPEATLVSFDYNKMVFGNIAVVIEVAKVKHTFTTDRGEIYHNGKMLCDSSYLYIEKEDTFSKLLQMIKKEVLLCG